MTGSSSAKPATPPAVPTKSRSARPSRPISCRASRAYPKEAYAALAGRYGYAARDVLELAATRGELAQPILPGLPDLLAEVALAARREQALSIGDVLLQAHAARAAGGGATLAPAQ